jgi:hypothetical protein
LRIGLAYVHISAVITIPEFPPGENPFFGFLFSFLEHKRFKLPIHGDKKVSLERLSHIGEPGDKVRYFWKKRTEKIAAVVFVPFESAMRV